MTQDKDLFHTIPGLLYVQFVISRIAKPVVFTLHIIQGLLVFGSILNMFYVPPATTGAKGYYLYGCTYSLDEANTNPQLFVDNNG